MIGPATLHKAFRRNLAAALAAVLPLAAQAQPVADEITVIGSRLKGERPISPSPVVTVSADDLAASGFTTPADLARTLAVNTGSEFNVDPFTQNLSAGTSNFNLRGLGLNATLVLLNGRRQTISGGLADDGSTFVDLNALIPLIALERLDVLKDGAAALYGTDAVAGVADFVTRNSFSGTEIQIDYANTAHSAQDDLTASGLVGGGNDRAHGIFAASYLRRSWLPATDRSYTAGKGFSSFGQPGAFILLERSPVFPDLPFGLANNQPIIDPNCAAGGGSPNPRNPQPAGVSSGRVGTCTFDFSSYYHLVPRERRWNTYSSGELNFDDATTVYAEAAYAWNAVLRGTSPSFPILNSPVVPANNPGNIFKVPVLFIGRSLGADNANETVRHTSATWRGVLGAKGEVAHGWTWDVAATHSENDFYVGINNDLTDRFLAALAGRGGPNNNQFFNPFGSAAISKPGDATYNDPAVIDNFNTTITYDYRTRLSTADATLTGDLFETAQGPWGLAVGGQYRHEKVIGDLNDDYNSENYIFFVGGPDFGGSRKAWAGFAEARGPLAETLQAQIALRHEKTGDFSSTDPKVGLTWQLVAWLLGRGTYGTSFRAPSVFQAFSIQSVQQDILDPITGTRGFRAVRTVGAAALKPEKAKTANVGLTLSPVKDFALSVDYWRFDYTDIIIKEGAQSLVNANPNDPRITRATGQILRVETSYINASKALTDGIDVSARQSWSTAGWGDFSASAEATWISRFILQDAPTAPRRNVAGNRNFNTFARSLPQWRGNASLGWTLGGHEMTTSVRYIGAYDDDQNANRRIKSQATLDLQYGYNFAGSLLGQERRAQLAVGALNMLDRAPPNVVTNAGFDSKVHDPRGRVLYVRLKTAWQ